MTHHTTLSIPLTTLTHYNAILADPAIVPKRKNVDVLASWTARFATCPGIEADINVVNGDDDTGPFVDAVLFDQGSEVALLDPAHRLNGDYCFTVNDTVFCVTVTAAA